MAAVLPRPALRAGRVSLDYADLRWRWLPASDVRRLGQNLELPAIRDVLQPFDRPTVHERLLVLAHGDEWRGTSLTLVVERDGEPLGLAGVVRHDDVLRTRTYLHPDLHGGGANGAAKQIAWALAGHTGLPLTAVVNEANVRSQAAMAKCRPAVRPTVGPACDRPGRSLLYRLDEPPGRGDPLDAGQTAALRQLAELTPFGAQLRPVGSVRDTSPHAPRDARAMLRAVNGRDDEDRAARLADGLLLTRCGDGFAAHEVFEDLWRSAPADERDFYQGLVHVAVAPYQQARGHRIGMRSQLEKAQRRLTPYAPSHRGVDVDAVLRWCRTALDRDACDGPPPV